MSKKLVTVAIPAYNHEKYVQEAITSIIRQTYLDIELIIINDGSTDNTNQKILELNDECMCRFKSFKYISRENQGLIPTLNEILSKAKGEYFVMMASDDIAIKTKIATQVNALELDNKCGMCFGRAIGIDDESNIVSSKYKNKYKNYQSYYTFNDLIVANYIVAPTVMLRTSAVRKVGGYDNRYKLEDLPLWLKISKNYLVKYIDEDLIYYRDHPTNVSKDRLFMIQEKENILLDWKDDKYYLKAISKHNLYTFNSFVKSKNKVLAKKYLFKALKQSWYKPKFLKALIRFLLLK